MRVERVGMRLEDLEWACRWRGRAALEGEGELAEARDASLVERASAAERCEAAMVAASPGVDE